MATREQAEMVARQLIEVHPARFFKVIHDTNAGFGLVLKLLYAAGGAPLTAGELSEAMSVSTARVAVLLNKLEAKGLIVRGRLDSDARVTVVTLSDTGRQTAAQMQEELLDHIATVIDRVGMEKLRQFIDLSVEVKAAMGDGFPPAPRI